MTSDPSGQDPDGRRQGQQRDRHQRRGHHPEGHRRRQPRRQSACGSVPVSLGFTDQKDIRNVCSSQRSYY